MNVQFNKRDPVYVQVIRHFKEQIATGVLEPGQEIPSRRELANRLKINPNTAQRAYKEMEEAGLIYTERNLPSKITKDEQVLGAVREELIDDAVDTFVHAIRSINVSAEDVLDRVKEKLETDQDTRGYEND
ncbi:GntR family transcriptional regulator [Lentibacillus halophilus]|uniref:GntR family transcriptional regulator n=1 Tax=Lentibacillus halophilus TaxID=295065 RepID=A0ABN0Z3L0_9BACI